MTMSDPIILEKLEQFSLRRKRLILARGLAATGAAWLVTLTLVALCDRAMLIEDEWRWLMSTCAYAVTAFVFWRACVRHLAHLPGPRDLARLVELAEPRLREELLAAIELPGQSATEAWDSAEFRTALQHTVAARMQDIHIAALLSPKLIKRVLLVALAVLAGFALLVALPGLRFSQFFARAALPAANLARPSHITIAIVAPAPPEQTVPEGESIPVVVDIGGGDVAQVVLETFPQRGARERNSMTLSAPGQFAAAVSVERDGVLYRVRAGDAITRKLLLRPQPRPQVVHFRKAYQPPAYTHLGTRTVTEDNGDLEALEGSEVDLEIQADQPVKEAALQLEFGKEQKTVPLQAAGARRLATRLTLTASGVYRVRLVAAGTGFENKYAPQYEIRVRPDLRPSAKIEKPVEEQQTLPPDALVNLVGSAADDLALTSLEQVIQINRGPWLSGALVAATGATARLERAWDLFALGVHPGDRVTTKLVATDLKGQRGESAPLRIMIAAVGFEPQRLQRVQRRQALDKTLQALREQGDELERKVNAAREAQNNPNADVLQKKQTLVAARAAAEDAVRKAGEALHEIQGALPHAASAREASDLANLGSAVSRAQHKGMEPVQAQLQRATDALARNDQPAAKEALKTIHEPLGDAVNSPRLANDVHHQLLAAEEAQAIARDLEQVNAEQHALAEQLRATPDDALQAERATRRLSVAADELKSVEKQMKQLTADTWGGPAESSRIHERELRREREKMETTLADATNLEKLKPQAEALQNRVASSANAMRAAERELNQRADTMRKALQDNVGQPAEAVAALKRQIERRDQPTQPENWKAATGELKDRAALEERKPHADAQFASDTARTADALEALNAVHGQQATNALGAVRALEEAYRKLDAGHVATQEEPVLRQLAAQERWEKTQTPAEAQQRAQDWKWAHQQMEALPQKMEQAQLPAEATRDAKKLVNSPAVYQASNILNNRQFNPADTHSAAEPLNRLANDAALVAQQLKPALEAARAEIEKIAPPLSAQLAAAAQAAKQMNKETGAQAEAAAKVAADMKKAADAQAPLAQHAEQAAKVRDEAGHLAGDQQQLDQRVDDVRAALRRDANKQDVTKAEGRERARDADDAHAMLRQPTPGANDLLQKAASTTQPEGQQSALKGAAEQQGKLADTLAALAEHYKNLEAGQPDKTREALREAEKDAGLKATLDGEYQKAQALAGLEGMTPEQQLAALEKTLPESKPMQHELSDIAKDALGDAAGQLQKNATKEQKLATSLGSPQEQAKQLAAAAKQLAQQDVPAIAQKAGQQAVAGKPDLDNAAQKLNAVAQNIPTDFSKQPEQLAQTVADQVAPLQQAAKALQEAGNKLGQQPQQNGQQGDPKTAQQQAQKAGQQAQKLAQQAGNLAQQLMHAQAQSQAAAAQQPAIQQSVQQAGNELERAGRHEQRLGQNDAGQQMQQLGQQIEQQTGAQIEQAQQALAQAAAPAQAQPAAQGAHDAIQQPLDKLAAMLQQPPAPASAATPAAPSQLANVPPETAQWMARALDSLDAALHPATPGQPAGAPPPGPSGQPSPSGQPPSQSAAAQAMAAAAQAQAQSMANARSDNLTPGQQALSQGESKGGGAATVDGQREARKLPEELTRLGGAWGKLPPKLARDLLEARREGAGGEYREMVEVYFRAIADKAREKQP
jgi:hypothetical protein